MSTPFTNAISILNDRVIRRLLGARSFLRGYNYVRRRAVSQIKIEGASAHAFVCGSQTEPYAVQIRLTSAGISSECSCPASSKIQGHCKHVAALLIALRDQVWSTGAGCQTPPFAEHSSGAVAGSPQNGHGFLVESHASSSLAHAKRNKRSRLRTSRGASSNGGRSGRARTEGILSSSTPCPSGVHVWLPHQGVVLPQSIEYRLQVKPGVLTVTLLDPSARTRLLPSTLLVAQDETPTPDRDAIRLLARLENSGSRRIGIEVRGEDASELLSLLKGRKVILEPAMMELRFGEEPLKARFDLDLSENGAHVFVKVSFARSDDSRRFTLTQGAWFEGDPGWHVDPQEGVARPIERRVSPATMRRLLRTPVLQAPMENLSALIAEGLPRVVLQVGAELPELSQVADVVDVVLTFRVWATGTLTDARVFLRAAYEDMEVDVRADGMTPPVMVKPPDTASPTRRARCIRCDIAAQQEAVEKLRELGLTPDEEGNGFMASGDDAVRFWTEGISTLPEEWDLFIPDDLVDVHVRTEVLGAHARVFSGVDWLSLRLSFEAEGVAVTQEELARCLAEGRRYVRLSEGSYARVDIQKVREVLQRQAEILATSNASNGRLPLSQAGRLQDLLACVNHSTVSDETRELFHKLKHIEEIRGTRKPRNLKASLRPYQEAGFHWLWFLHEIGSGGVLADDMGLGKTLQTIALLLAVKNADEKEASVSKPFKALIVAPTSVVTNWMREIDRFAPSLRHAVWHGIDRKERTDELENAEVVITSYALLRRDEGLLSGISWRYVVLDEAQNIKNPLSATARAAKCLPADRRLALTGTPIENRLSEIWSIFDFVSPELLGCLDRFEEKYSRPIEAGDTKMAERLRAAIHPFILRRTKGEVAKDLPEKIEADQFCELTGEQAALYAAVLREVRAQVMGEVERVGVARSHLQILSGLTRLRQAACDPRLLGLPRDFTDEDSGKIMALRELIQTCVAGGHRVLVFSQFVSMLQIICRLMEQEQVLYEYLDGATKDRLARVENFQREDGPPVFLISLKAGGSGLNLTAADTVIHFDPWWNPAVEDQATDRVYRLGQTKVVTAYRLIAKGTIEEKILELGGKKRELVGTVLSEDVGGAKKLTKGDLEELFRFDG
ncbi:hypothetical protein BCY86_03140 [Pajaroellobacter abortibovis]|uniref:Helicase n=1 Tax=Pajaroellobacter abortibovis TaxID=1882918 RepID=A0A1L6MW91_9BACT|nr:hypothetical protein BCY86_03140 [Pajaroellobacter abortibovis]